MPCAASPVPKAWKDLLKPEYRGVVGYLDPTSAAVGYAAAAAANLALGGTLDNWRPGIDYFKALKQNRPIVPLQTAYARVLSGEIPIMFDYDFNTLRAKYKDKCNCVFVIPQEGTIALPYVMSLVKNGPHPENAKKVLDYLLSDKGQAIWANAYLRPIRPSAMTPDIAAKFPPGGIQARQGHRLRQDGGRAERLPRPLSEGSPLAATFDRIRRAGARAPAFFMRGRENRNLLVMVLPALIVGAAFFLIPLARLAVVGGTGGLGLKAYLAVVTNRQYFEALVSTIVLSVLVTAATLAIAGIAGVFLERNRFLGREALISHAHAAARVPRGRDRLHGHHARRAHRSHRRSHVALRGGPPGVRLLHGGTLHRLHLFLHSRG